MLRPVTRIIWYGWLIVLLLPVAPTAAFGQSLVCHSIRRGESATQAARRVTGDSRNAYQASFQIRNGSSRFIPKSQYNRILAGWHACVRKPAVQRAPVRASDEVAEALTSREVSAASVTSEALPAVAVVPGVLVTAEPVDDTSERLPLELTMLWLGAVMVVPWVGWRILDDHLVRTKTTTIVMRHFASRFVHEFERPLLWSDGAERALQSRVRYSARRRKLDILLAPGGGRRYPNLSDHKKNVEYDVARVLHVLDDGSFVSGPLYTQAGWVVVPFQFKAGPRQSGVTCISSF